MLNRTQAPVFKQVGDIHFIQPKAHHLANGIPLYAINGGDQELVRLEFIFQNVSWDAKEPLLAVAINGLINTGTGQLSAKQIADKVDYYGAFLQTEYNADYTNIVLYSLTKHLPSVLPVVHAILTDAVFPQDELAIYQQNQKQKLQVNLKKNDYVGRRTFANAIFGDSPYGSIVDEPHFDQLSREKLVAYYQDAFKPNNCTIMASGKITDATIGILDKVFGGNWGSNTEVNIVPLSFGQVAGQNILIEKPDALQSAIRMGNLSINRNHEDFPALQFVNCILGGYFGSRLMANIREDKGYTYGIGSGVASLKQAGYFFIGTEVGADVCQSAVEEIEKEISILRSQPVPAEELNLVRNYMLGSLLGSLENAFSHADKFKNIYFSGLDFDYYQRYIQTIKNIDEVKVAKIANQYLNFDDMVKVVVGRK